jgi:hypothetical protein
MAINGGYGPLLGGSDSSLGYLAGTASTPLVEKAAEGNTTLDQQQRAAVLGDPVPIVFCRRLNNSGGVLISPPAAEARFENDSNNTLTASYRLILSEGNLAAIQIRDVFQVSCRIGTMAQAYNGPAGSWITGNAMVARAGYTVQECPSFCGTGGNYADISTLSFTASYPNEDTTWDRQIHVFMRSGIPVTRLVDGVTGPSNNFADFMVLALKRSSRVPSRLIDTASMTAAAKFLDVNGLYCDVKIEGSVNLEEYLSTLAPKFLLRPTKINGKHSLKPLLPTTSTGAINTGTIDWKYQFTASEILDRFEINYTPLVDRKPFCSQMIWRQQQENDIGITRTVLYRPTYSAENGPFESTDLSAFCTTENHAVKVAAYDQARRNLISHTLSINIKAGPWNANLATGDIVRVTMQRQSADYGTTWHDYLYEVSDISRLGTGEIGLELLHFPVSTTGASLVALSVAAATGTGVLLDIPRSGPSCDTNSSTATDTAEKETYGMQTKEDAIEYEETAVNEGEPGGTTTSESEPKNEGSGEEPANNDEKKTDEFNGTISVMDPGTGKYVPINPYRVALSGISLKTTAWGASFPGGGSSGGETAYTIAAGAGEKIIGYEQGAANPAAPIGNSFGIRLPYYKAWILNKTTNAFRVETVGGNVIAQGDGQGFVFTTMPIMTVTSRTY